MSWVRQSEWPYDLANECADKCTVVVNAAHYALVP